MAAMLRMAHTQAMQLTVPLPCTLCLRSGSEYLSQRCRFVYFGGETGGYPERIRENRCSASDSTMPEFINKSNSHDIKLSVDALRSGLSWDLMELCEVHSFKPPTASESQLFRPRGDHASKLICIAPHFELSISSTRTVGSP